MKVVCSTDWHGDWTTFGVPRFDEVARAANHTADEALRLRAGLYVFAGDLSEPEGPGMLRSLELLVSLASRLWRQHIPLLALTGNHDVMEDGLRTSNLTPLRDVPGVVLADRPQLDKFGTRSKPGSFVTGGGGEPGQIITVCSLPFTPRTHGYDPRAFVREHASEHVDLVVGHLMLEGIGPGSETRDMPRGRDVFLPVKEIREAWPNAVILNGHYHTKQVFNGVHLPGSLCRLMQVEADNEPSYAVMDLP